jgi:Ca-activated chloride channel family protein
MLTLGQNADVPPQTAPPLRVDIDLVLLTATVKDRANRYVRGLTQESFQIWEDKTEQQIRYFSEEDVPLSVGIIFDISGSMANKLAPARAAASTFLRMGERGDEYFLIEFSDRAGLVQDFTTDITKLQNSLLATYAKGGTSLYDALYFGMEKVNRGHNSRKALLLITDGEDNHSRYSFSDVREFAKEHDVLVYSIGLLEEQSTQLPRMGAAVLQDLANITGGIAFFPDSIAALDAICAQIGNDLKNQYVIGYHSTNPNSDGKWRKIRMKVNMPKGAPRLSVRAKSGYYASKVASAMK